MKTSALAILLSALAFTGSVHAQAPASEIRESTDPARVADVEQRAADLQARQQAARLDMTSGGSGGKDGSSSASGSGDGGKQDKRHSGHVGTGHGQGHGARGGQGSSSSR